MREQRARRRASCGDALRVAVGESDGARAVGRIDLSSGLTRLITEDELKFVLAHQCARIAYNHATTRAVWLTLRPDLHDPAIVTRSSFDLATHFVSVRDALPPSSRDRKTTRRTTSACSSWQPSPASRSATCFGSRRARSPSSPEGRHRTRTRGMWVATRLNAHDPSERTRPV